MNTDREYKADEIGVLKMDMSPRKELHCGDVGFGFSPCSAQPSTDETADILFRRFLCGGHLAIIREALRRDTGLT